MFNPHILHLSSMGHPKIIDHQYISSLPAVEHHVLPDYITDVPQMPRGNLGAITKGGMKANLARAKEGEDKKFE